MFPSGVLHRAPQVRSTKPTTFVGLATGLVVFFVTEQAQSASWTATRWTADDGLTEGAVTALHQTADRFLWVATAAGVSRFDGSRFVPVPRERFEGAAERFHPLALCGEGGTNFWIATAEAVYQRTPAGPFARLPMANAGDTPSIRTLTPRQAGGRQAAVTGPLWIGTDRGVYELDRGALRPFGTAPAGAVTHLAESVGALGVGAADGSWLLRSGMPAIRLMEPGDSADACPPVVSAGPAGLWTAGPAGAGQVVGLQSPKLAPLRRIRPDCYRFAATGPDGTRWLVGDRVGLIRVSPTESTVIPSTEAATIGPITAMLADDVGRVWLGTAAGLLCVQPGGWAVTEPPHIRWEGLSFNGTPVPPGAPAGWPAASVDELQFRFAAPLRLPTDGVRYAHRLSGSRPGAWVESAEPEIRLRGLAAGNYVLEVRARADRGAWGPVVSRRFELTPDLLHSPAFHGLLAIVGSGLLAASAWWRLRWRNRRRPGAAANSLLSSERERIARDLHDDIGSQLTALALQAELLGRRAGPDLAGELEILAQQARGAAGRMSDIVWQLNPACDTLASFGSFLAAHSERWSELTGTRIRVEIPPELPAITMSPPARRHLAMVVQEALTNVAKHAGATEAKLVLRYGPEHLLISVQDNGQGFDPAEAAAAPAGNSSNGLRNQRARVEELRGTLELRSRFGGGTRLDVTVPLASLNPAG